MYKENISYKIITSFILQFIFWILIFAFSRMIFLIYYSGDILSKNIDFLSIISVFFYALKLDISTASYILLLPFIILLIQSFYSPKWINYVNKIYTILILFVNALINGGELGIYEEWQTKLNYKALLYLKQPKEAFDSISTSIFLILLLIISLQVIAGYYIYIKFIYRNLVSIGKSYLFTVLFLILTPIVLILGIRGGLQQIPINQSESYFSKHEILNLAAVNSFWNLGQSYYKNANVMSRNLFNFYKLEEAKIRVERIQKPEKDSTINILKIRKPNIVLIILESWSADLIESLGGKNGITPNFSKLEKEGILFTRAYASGARSDQGMGAILSGFPATPKVCIIHNPSKFVKLPMLNKFLLKEGYSSSFYFGGQLIFRNIKGYIYSSKFGRVIEGKDFGSDVIRGKLGVHDEFVLSRQLKEINKDKEPFFSVIFTASTHSPYDMPMKRKIFWGGKNSMYLNSAFYTDKCIGEYFKEAKKHNWYKNTLFVLVADHSHNSYKNWDPISPEYHKIPILFVGDAIKEEYKGTQIHSISSQHDIPSTILSQLGIDSHEFKWSKNLFNIYSPSFAYYEVPDGLGWIRPFGEFTWQDFINRYKILKVEPYMKDSLIKEGKSYLQVLWQDYLNY